MRAARSIRVRLAALVVLAACGGVSRGASQPSQLRCVADDPDAPIAVMRQRGGFASRVFPDLIVWADGEVVLNGERARVSPATAQRTVGEAARRLRDLDRYVSSGEDMSDQPEVELSVRDGEIWRQVTVQGITVRGADGEAAPAAFASAAGLLLHMRLAGVGRYQADQIRVELREVDPVVEPTAWPDGVPAPPMSDDRPTAFVVPGAHLAELRRLGAQPIAIAGRSWAIALRPVYRGQPAIERMLECEQSR